VGDHVIAVVYSPLLAIEVTGVEPATGAVIETFAIVIVVGPGSAWACELIAAPAKISARAVPAKVSADLARLETLKSRALSKANLQNCGKAK